MAFSSVGKKKLAAQGLLFFINILVLAFASRVNQFQEYFYVADLFPFALSIITLVLLTTMITLDLATTNAFIGRAQYEIGIFTVMSILWLAFNAFSTSRWSDVPLQCGTIPEDFSDIRTWCRDLQALKAFIWIEWLTFFLITVVTARYAVTQNTRGHKHIFKVPLSRYSPVIRHSSFGVSHHWGMNEQQNYNPFERY
ncbi:hypothetical protein AAF712_012105 [Marasmius tenuissimus]|uniref:MARVEL domain-containing protein n=1 Tax=Marasmius tenuissimus TaxID=585030 RepID=A0ABR2ZJD8_9AGAR|nr:hypothetical protein PM082_012726 [Marasmius tenuissimus]